MMMGPKVTLDNQEMFISAFSSQIVFIVQYYNIIILP